MICLSNSSSNNSNSNNNNNNNNNNIRQRRRRRRRRVRTRIRNLQDPMSDDASFRDLSVFNIYIVSDLEQEFRRWFCFFRFDNCH